MADKDWQLDDDVLPEDANRWEAKLGKADIATRPETGTGAVAKLVTADHLSALYTKPTTEDPTSAFHTDKKGAVTPEWLHKWKTGRGLTDLSRWDTRPHYKKYSGSSDTTAISPEAFLFYSRFGNYDFGDPSSTVLKFTKGDRSDLIGTKGNLVIKHEKSGVKEGFLHFGFKASPRDMSNMSAKRQTNPADLVDFELTVSVRILLQRKDTATTVGFDSFKHFWGKNDNAKKHGDTFKMLNKWVSPDDGLPVYSQFNIPLRSETNEQYSAELALESVVPRDTNASTIDTNFKIIYGLPRDSAYLGLVVPFYGSKVFKFQITAGELAEFAPAMDYVP